MVKTVHWNLKVSQANVEKMLRSVSEDTASGTDNLDGKVLKVNLNTNLSFFNRSVLSGTFPDLWKRSKTIPLLKDAKAGFTGSNRRPISLLPC